MDLLHLVDRLEELVAEAQKMPIGNRVIIDRRRLLDLVDQMRVSVPHEVREARDLVTDRDRIRRESEEEARLIVARAEEEALRRVDDHSLATAARERAQQIADEAELRLQQRIEQANQDIQARIEESRHLARQQMQAADEYARELLVRLERQLQAFVGSVRSGIEQVEPERELPPAPVPGEFDPGPVDPGKFDSAQAFESLPEEEETASELAIRARPQPPHPAAPSSGQPADAQHAATPAATRFEAADPRRGAAEPAADPRPTAPPTAQPASEYQSPFAASAAAAGDPTSQPTEQPPPRAAGASDVTRAARAPDAPRDPRAAIELPAATADRETTATRDTATHDAATRAGSIPPPSAARDTRSGFGRPAPPEERAADEFPASPRTPEDRATRDDEQLEDLLGEARRTADPASLEDLEGDDIDPDELIDDFANPPLDDDPLAAPELESERTAEERASRTNGDH